MIGKQQKRIDLIEHIPSYRHEEEITEEIGKLLWMKYKDQVYLEPPSFITKRRWKFVNNGWVGRIPLTHELEIALLPKVSIQNIFGMLEYAYDLNDKKRFRFIDDGLANCDSLDEFYERLAIVLAKNILERFRKGLYRAYKSKNEQLPYIRGRLNARQIGMRPWDVRLECKYEEHTPNVPDNQILSWTLQRILHSGLCKQRSLPMIRQSYKALQSLTTPATFKPCDCIGRLYNRLNQDYEPMHALCRFFLENSGPTHQVGDHTLLPFLVDMDHLYELFVAEWIKAHIAHLPRGFSVRSLEKVVIGQERKVRFEIDLVLYKDGEACCVLDTKYKMPDRIKNPDFSQVVTYALAKKCHEAVLIYPKVQENNFCAIIDDIRVQGLTFSLEGDLDKAGEAFLKELAHIIS